MHVENCSKFQGKPRKPPIGHLRIHGEQKDHKNLLQYYHEAHFRQAEPRGAIHTALCGSSYTTQMGSTHLRTRKFTRVSRYDTICHRFAGAAAGVTFPDALGTKLEPRVGTA